MTPGHQISVDSTAGVHRRACQCGRHGSYIANRDRAVAAGQCHATAEARRQVQL